MPAGSRRQLLTGGLAADVLRETGAAIADDLAAARPLPFAGDTVRLETHGMACPWGVVLDPGPPDRALIASEALQEVQRIERLLSVYRHDTPVSELNRTAGRGPQPVAAELWHLLMRCRELYVATGGAFDPATQALIGLWRECRQAGRVPTQPELDRALLTSGLSHVLLRGDDADSGHTVELDDPGVGLNFGAIGKGYALDCVAERLRSGGLAEFLVHGGHSSVVARGGHAGQVGWPVGLKNPLFTEESYLLLLLCDQALGTSGSNIQYFRHEGRRYGHILDPRTGWPAEQLLSVSVLARTAAEADALSTAFYVLGLEKALEYCHTHPEVGAVLTPAAERGRQLAPVVCNVPAERVFVTTDTVELRWAAAAR